ncbi:MAG: hypothetical protein AAAB35_18955 [Phyllobacterium sp.]|uniref:hypothetical protein n=1 Tax=Phyllobacterium sp. TaxID=1871046 RepID=UPI0030F2F642
MMPLFDRRERLIDLISVERPKAGSLADIVPLARIVDPQMPLREIRDAWTMYKHRRGART